MTNWKIDRPPRQIGGKGSDYACWIEYREEGPDGFAKKYAAIHVQFGQCGDEPEGDAIALLRAQAMTDGLNAAHQSGKLV